MLYICTKFCEYISNGFRVTDRNIRVDARMVTFTKGHNSVNTVSRHIDVALCTLSDNTLYLYQVS